MTTSPALTALFNQIIAGTNTTACDFDCYTITLFGGGALYYTTADFDITFNGNLYSSGTVRIDDPASKTQAHWKVGLDVDQWTVVFKPRPVDPITGAAFPDQIGGVPFLLACHGGALDAADFQVDRVYFSAMPTWPMAPGGPTPVASKTIFAGVIAEVDLTTSAAVLTVNDYRLLLNQQMPRHFWQAHCIHTWADAGCALIASNYVEAGAVQAGSTPANIVAAGLPVHSGTPGTYALGRIVMTSGLNAGFQRTVRSWDGTNLALFNPLPFTLQVGDTFNAYPGCSKLLTACESFGNQLNFLGFPFIPVPETAV